MRLSIPLSLSLSLCAVAGLSASSCSPGTTLEADHVYLESPTCLPDVTQEVAALSTSDVTGLGYAIQTTRYSAGLFAVPPVTQSPNVSVFASAVDPAAGYVGGLGKVYERRIDADNGEDDGLGQVLSEFSGGRFGNAVLGADLVLPEQDGSRAPYRWLAAGDELIVGDPTPIIGFDRGAIYWYHNAYSGPVDPASWGQADLYRWEKGGHFVPAGLFIGAEFGAALSSPTSSFGGQVPFVAVGAPGQEGVVILAVNSSWTSTGSGSVASPFTDTPTTRFSFDSSDLGAVTGGVPVGVSTRGFGSVLEWADLDGDALPELIVGAPGVGSTPLRGAVVVIRGQAAFPHVDLSDIAVLTHIVDGDGEGASTPGDEFGASIAVGPAARNHPGPILAVGAPGVATKLAIRSPIEADHGSVCQFAFVQGAGSLTLTSGATPAATAGPSPVCRLSPFPHSPGDQQRFGQSIAIGNFAPLDRVGDDGSTYALTEELAIGTPGGRELVDLRGGVVNRGTDADASSPAAAYSDASAAVVGTVSIFASGDDGVEIGYAGTTKRGLYLRQYLGSSSGAPAAGGDAFGSNLVAADLQQNGYEDLVVSAQGRGKGSLFYTRSSPANGLTTGLAGDYWVEDSLGGSLPAKVLSLPDGHTIHVDGFALKLEDTSGDVCEFGDFTGSLVTNINTAPVDIDAANDVDDPVTILLEFDEADVGESDMAVTGEIFFDDGADDGEFVVTFDEPTVDGSDPWPDDDCTFVGSPFIVDFSDALSCE